MLDKKSIQQRQQVLQIIKEAGRGHIGSAFSILEITRVLYDDILNIDPKNPTHADRDRFILSKGHGCLALYVQLAAHGFFSTDELWRVSQSGAMLGGHPEFGLAPGIEASTGSLGHGLSIGVGMALAAKIDQKSHRVFVLLGDGECNEGSVWEAALAARQHQLDRLTVLVDYNQFQCYSHASDILSLEPFADKWRSFGFSVSEVDGHDVTALREVLLQKSIPDTPRAIICHTTKGKGLADIENNPLWHHKSRLPADDVDALINKLEADS